MHPRFTSSVLVAVLVVLAPAGARAQAIGQGFDLERSGQIDAAATYYLSTARTSPASLAALLGLERVLPQLNRMPELLPLVQRAVARDTASTALRGLLVRTYVALDLPDSAAAVTERWAGARPGDEAPYREWALALADKHFNEEARQVLLAGRTALGQPTAFAIELAALAEQTGDWEDAAREWGTVVATAPAQAQTAVSQLATAPAEQRDRIVGRLTEDASPSAARLAAELVLGWGDSARAWALLESTLDASLETAFALRRFADLAGAPGTPAAWRVRALALSRFADIVPEGLAVRARADAAHAFLEAGDPVQAQAQLARVAADPAAPLEVRRLAQVTLIRALIGADHLDSAGAELARVSDRLTGDDIIALRLALARARVHHGDLARADSVLGNDSSMEVLTLQGWLALYHGDVQRARELFRSAGPYVGGSREATERTEMMALLERIPEARFPAFGDALLALARGDSAVAVTALRQAAGQLTAEHGRGEVLLLAGRICARLGPLGEATAALLFDEVVRMGGPGAAPPAAELAWAELLLGQGHNEAAVQHLEHLILVYSESAVVPEARRRLDQAKGAIPQS